MIGYIAKRLMRTAGTLFAVSLIAFAITRAGEDRFERMIAECEAQGEAACREYVEHYKAVEGFNDPIWQQYVYWATDGLSAAFGLNSYTCVFSASRHYAAGDAA